MKRSRKVQFYTDAGGEHRWRLRAANGAIIADCGEGYTTRSSARRGWRTARTAILRGGIVEEQLP